VTIALTGHRQVQGLDQAAVSVNFQQQVERDVLAVPVTALLATAGGGYAVQTTENGRRQLIAVTPGLFAGGYVQVSGAGLVEGMQVSDSQG
jgi:multidrug efflux pump subunit AcrA (membrane-fusion protein)